MFIRGAQAEKNILLSAAEKMCLAARTAPKAKGVDKKNCYRYSNK